MFVTSDNVILDHGMNPAHAHKVAEFVQRIYRRKLLLLIVRAGKQTGLQWHKYPHAYPKPLHVKDKVPREAGWVRVGGKVYYSDYDLQGVFELSRHGYTRLETGQHGSLGAESTDRHDVFDLNTGAPGLNEFLRVLNFYVLGAGVPARKWMFRHGANDEYLKADSSPGRYPEQDERFLAFESTGQIRAIDGRGALADYYRVTGLPWIYV